MVVLGYELFEGGYRLASKFLDSWGDPTPPTSLKALQKLLGKMLWCAPFVPNYKSLVAPVEALLSPKGGNQWTEECTAAVNQVLTAICQQITVCQADPHAPL